MQETKNKIFTIPNIISLFRILLIPAFIFFYFTDNYLVAAIILGVSGLSDVADGFIARKFNMISKFGKIIDPIADKLTQASIGVCLTIKHTELLPVLILFCIKETLMLIGAFILFKHNLRPAEAKWWGKLGTVMIFILLCAIIFSDIFPNIISNTAFSILMGATAICIALALCAYSKLYSEIRNGLYDTEKEKHITGGKKDEQ